MRISPWAVAFPFILWEATLCASSALLHFPSMRNRAGIDELGWKASRRFEGELERRAPQSDSNSGGLSLSTPNMDRNVSTLQACQNSIQSMTNVSNDAGFAVCYNILDWHESLDGTFEADLRLFQFSTPTGQFADIPMNSITVYLDYPNSTQWSILVNAKRSLLSLERRQTQGSPQEIQQFSLVGSFKTPLNSKKLNSTELMSLLIPQISLQATSNGTNVTAKIQSSDVAYFVAGQFKDEATPQLAAKAANPAMAAVAIAASKGFVLPGTTLGIFPVGLIVTSSWTFLFLLTFGLGTLGRKRHRDMYRKRVEATSRMCKR